MNRVYNFAAGPSMMPEEALQTAAREMLDYRGTGMSVMEMSHRSAMYQEIFDETEALVRELMGVPENYSVLFLQGGATGQFAAIPLNLLSAGQRGLHRQRQFRPRRADRGAEVRRRAHAWPRPGTRTMSRIPAWNPADFDPEADYFYITTNNTIFGTRYASPARDGQGSAGGGHVQQHSLRGL